MGKLLVIKNADFSVNAIDTQPVPPGPTPSGEWVVGYKALFDKYLALSGLSEQNFINTYCSKINLNPFYFIDKNKLMSDKTVTKAYTIANGTVNTNFEYGICDGWNSANKNILNPVLIGTFITTAGQPAGEITLVNECQVPSDKYFYWRIASGGGDGIFYGLDATKLSGFNPTDLKNLDGIEAVVSVWSQELIMHQLDFFIE